MFFLSRVLWFSYILTLPAILAQSNNEIPIPHDLEVWFTSAPAAPDLIDMLSDYDNPRFNWSTARRYLDGIKFYQGQLVDPPFPLVKGNTYNNLSRAGSFWIVHNRFKQKISIEVGAIKWHNCFLREGLNRAVNEVVASGINLYKAGGVLFSFDIDTSLGPCNYKPKQVGFLTATWSMRVEDALNKELAELKITNPSIQIEPIKFRDIEPYPGNSLRQHQEYIEKFNMERINQGYAPLDAYYLDVDDGLVTDQKLARDINILIDFLHARNIKVGLIINGNDPQSYEDNNDLFYLRSANNKLARYKRLGLLDRVDIIMVQSWVMRYMEKRDENEGRDLPANVPESAITHTNFLVHALRCIANIVDCNLYPSPE